MRQLRLGRDVAYRPPVLSHATFAPRDTVARHVLYLLRTSDPHHKVCLQTNPQRFVRPWPLVLTVRRTAALRTLWLGPDDEVRHGSND